MSYSQQAESYAMGKVLSFAPAPFSTPDGWCKFNDVYSDIADATPGVLWQASELIGRLPSISHLSEKVQIDILHVVLRDMQRLPPEADRIQKVKQGWYRWLPGDRK